MLREVSTTISMAMPSRRTSVVSNPHCGRASATTHRISARARSAGIARCSHTANERGQRSQILDGRVGNDRRPMPPVSQVEEQRHQNQKKQGHRIDESHDSELQKRGTARPGPMG